MKLYRKLTIIALFSDDDLAERFALKGGTALDLIHKITARSSVDIDVSMENDFTPEELPQIESKLYNAIQSTYNENNLTIFDFNFSKKPLNLRPSQPLFWGGYCVKFKIYNGIKPIEELETQQGRQSAQPVSMEQAKTFSVDISKYEFTSPSDNIDIDNFTVRVYTLDMIIYEKLRAICQQLPGYALNQGYIRKARPKDFFDIYKIMTEDNASCSFNTIDTEILASIFKAKEVPLSLLFDIQNYKEEVYNAGIPELESTILTDEELPSFEEIFTFVIDGVKAIPNINHYLP